MEFAKGRSHAAPLTVLLFCIRALLHLYSRKLQKFFVRLNALGQEFAVLEQRIGRDRSGDILRLLPVSNMNDLQWHVVRSRGLFHARHPVVSKRALVGIIEDKASLFHRRVLGTGLESRRRCILRKCRYIRSIPHSDVSATANPLYARYFGSERNSRFRPSDERMHSPFRPCFFASRMHSSSRSLEYPCPFSEPETHRQSI